MRSLSLLILAATGLAFGQRYEAVSIEPSDPGAQGVSMGVDKGGMFTAINVPVKALIAIAYDVRVHRITGAPNWLTSERYDIVARPEKYAENTTLKIPQTEMMSMARSLLRERFKLTGHVESREGPVYSLVFDKSGAQLHRNTSGSGRQGWSSRRGEMTGYRLTPRSFAMWLSEEVARTVVDNTGLKGEFDVELRWSPDLAEPDSAAATDGSSIFTAVQDQLGLKLVPAKGPVEVLVVEHAEKPFNN